VVHALQAQGEHPPLRAHSSHAVKRVSKAALADAEDVTEVRDRDWRRQVRLNVGFSAGDDGLSRREGARALYGVVTG